MFLFKASISRFKHNTITERREGFGRFISYNYEQFAIINRDLILVVPSPLATVFTKMPFCHSKLQTCHSWADEFKFLPSFNI